MTSYIDQANTGSDEFVSSRQVTRPAGAGAGDVGVFWLVRWNGDSDFPPVTPPAGAVLRGTVTTGDIQTLCYLQRITTENSFAFSWTGSRWAALAAVFLSGADPLLDLATTPFDSATGSGTSITTLSVTAAGQAALAWHVNTMESASGVTHTPPDGFTEAADVPPWVTAYRIAPGDGPQPAAGAALSGSRLWAAALVALDPPAAGTELALTAAAETGTARPLAATKTTMPAAAAALDAALPVPGAKTAAPAAAAGLHTARPLTGAKTAALQPAHTTDTARPPAAALTAPLAPAATSSTAAAFHATTTATLAPAHETALAVALHGPDVLPDHDYGISTPYSLWAAAVGNPHGTGWEVSAPA
ncbi:hypothetical protein [Streptomyces synnematoformans]|uniref:Minor tail protein n=1 Tax=Streptomyces synnematoformans TaxID=415721 RepID=A0ABP5IXA4_9ACTN